MKTSTILVFASLFILFTGISYGLLGSYTVAGAVFIDNNGNSVFDEVEKGFAGTTVYLKTIDDSSGAVLHATTSSRGFYMFRVTAGSYRIYHTVPSGYVKTTDDSHVLSVPSERIWNFGIKPLSVAQCGNGRLEGNEQCDDGNTNNNDACKKDCTLNTCNDGVVYTGVEACDNGANNGQCPAICSASCTANNCIFNQTNLTQLCTDTDSGLNYNLKGTARSGNVNMTDFCSGSILYEYYCSGSSVFLSFYNCIKGCNDGACVPANQTNNTITVSYINTSANQTFWNITGDIKCNNADSCAVNSGQTTIISWTSRNADQCGVYVGSSTYVWRGTLGTETVALSSSTIYNLECWNTYEQKIVDSVFVNVTTQVPLFGTVVVNINPSTLTNVNNEKPSYYVYAPDQTFIWRGSNTFRNRPVGIYRIGDMESIAGYSVNTPQSAVLNAGRTIYFDIIYTPQYTAPQVQQPRQPTQQPSRSTQQPAVSHGSLLDSVVNYIKNFFSIFLRTSQEPPLSVPVTSIQNIAGQTDKEQLTNYTTYCQTNVPCLQTSSGQIIGTLTDDESLEQFLGIPYAEAPIGNLRWKKPQPKTSWTTPLIAKEIGPACIQTGSSVNVIPGVNVKGTQSEDCLNLNIWRPKGKTGLPILFWIHGGGYINGAGSHPVFAVRPDLAQNAVLVTINYRLGPIGFLAHPQLSAENPEKISGNYGLYDILFALQWVKENAEALGGDPNKLLIFGESAGGNAVTTLVQSPLAENLFTSAVIQSSVALKPSITKNALRDEDPNQMSGEELGVLVAKHAGCDSAPSGGTTIDCLRKKTPKDIERAFYAATKRVDPFLYMPYIDGLLIIDTSWNQFRSGNFNKVPIIIGLTKDELLFSTRDELLIFNQIPSNWQEVEKLIREDGAQMGVKDLDGLVALYSSKNYDSPSKAIGYYSYDTNFFCPVRNFLRTIPQQHNIPVRGYYYAHDTSFLPVGSAHGTELFYLFGSAPFKALFKPEELPFASTLQKAWTSVAQGNPYIDGIGAWPTFNSGKDNWAQLDLKPQLVSGMRDKECNFLDSQQIYYDIMQVKSGSNETNRPRQIVTPIRDSIPIQPSSLGNISSNYCKVKSIEKIGDGVQARWSQLNNLIVFSKKINKALEIHTMKTDGTDIKCLTCGKTIPGIAFGAHKGQAAWHPNGKYIVFLAINDHGNPQTFTDFPGVGSNVDVYIMTADGNQYWQVTDYPAEWGALFPIFSNNGQKLSWSEEYSCSRSVCPAPTRGKGDSPCCVFGIDVRDRAPGEELGLWRIKTANLEFLNGIVPIFNTRASIEVNHNGKRMLEGAGFTPDDNGLIFESVDITYSNNHAVCADVYTSDLSGNYASFRKLSNSPLRHEENSAYSPDGKKIAYTSGPAIGITYKTDLYLMDADGSNEKRLTHFIDTETPCSNSSSNVGCYNGYIHIVGDPSWSLDGRKLIFWAWNGQENKASDATYSENLCSGQNFDASIKKAIYQLLHWPDFAGNLYMLEFEGACGNS